MKTLIKTVAIFTVLIAVLVLIPNADGGDCRRVTYYHQPTYYTPSYDYNQYALVVAKAVPVYLSLASYTSVGDGARDYFQLKQATKEGVLEAMRELQAGPQPQQQPAAAATPNAPPVAGPPGATNLAPKVYTTIKDVIFNRCASCHDPKKDPARTNWAIDPDKIPGKIAKAGALKCTLGLMPKRGPGLPDQELGIIATWADQKGDD